MFMATVRVACKHQAMRVGLASSRRQTNGLCLLAVCVCCCSRLLHLRAVVTKRRIQHSLVQDVQVLHCQACYKARRHHPTTMSSSSSSQSMQHASNSMVLMFAMWMRTSELLALARGAPVLLPE